MYNVKFNLYNVKFNKYIIKLDSRTPSTAGTTPNREFIFSLDKAPVGVYGSVN